MPDWLAALIFFVGFPGLIVLVQHVWRNVGTYKAVNLSDRGRALITEKIPLVQSLPDNLQRKLFEQITQLRKTCNFRVRYATSSQTQVLNDLSNDEQAILLGHLALLTLRRSTPFPTEQFPIAITGIIPLQSEPIIQGRPGTVYPRTVSWDDLSFDRVLNALGLSPFTFQIAKFLADPELKVAKPEHRGEYNQHLEALDRAYKEIIVEPAEALATVSGEPESIPSPYAFLLEQQKKFFGSYADYQDIDPRIRTFLDLFYGERRQVH
jgi:hypothetical protein